MVARQIIPSERKWLDKKALSDEEYMSLIDQEGEAMDYSDIDDSDVD